MTTTESTTQSTTAVENLEDYKKLDIQRVWALEEVKNTDGVSEDVKPEDIAVIGQLVNAQTSHERTVSQSMEQVMNVERTELKERTKLKVKMLNPSNVCYQNIELPEDDGQFGIWKITDVTGWDSDIGIRTSATFETEGYRIELKVFNRDAYANLVLDEKKEGGSSE